MTELREEFDTTCPYCQQEHTAIATIEFDDPDQTYYCKKDTDSGPCSREVDDALGRCWQHEEEEVNDN